jgi:hypothetical protein
MPYFGEIFIAKERVEIADASARADRRGCLQFWAGAVVVAAFLYWLMGC